MPEKEKPPAMPVDIYCWYNGAFYVTQQTKALPDVMCLVVF
jgi:hypothetical protein